MLKWSLDAISLVSTALVVATASLLPFPATAAVASAELVFAALCAYRLAAHQSEAAPPGQVADGLRLFARLLDPAEGHLRLLRSCRFLSEWFMGADPAKLGTRNITDFLAYTLFNSHPTTPMEGADKAQLASLLERFLAASGLSPTTATEGAAGPDARFMASLRDPLRVSYRPLFFYLVMESVALSAHLRLLLNGFRLAKVTALCTFFESTAVAEGVAVAADGGDAAAAAPAAVGAAIAATAASPAGGSDEEDREVPIIFLHGIGAGLAPYVGFLQRIAAGGTARVYGVQYKHVSMRLTTAIPSPPEVANDVLAFMNERGIAKARIVAHSYGTLVAASLCKRHGDRVASATLIDPVCFALFLPNLIKNSLYTDDALVKPPVSPFSFDRLRLRSLLKGVVVRDLHCAVAMCRKLVWGEVNLWPSEMPQHTTIVLSGLDNLVPVQEVREILDTMHGAGRNGLDVMYHPTHGHGGFVLDLPWQARIVAKITGAPLLPVLPDSLDAAAAATAIVATAAAAAALQLLQPPPPHMLVHGVQWTGAAGAAAQRTAGAPPVPWLAPGYCARPALAGGGAVEGLGEPLVAMVRGPVSGLVSKAVRQCVHLPARVRQPVVAAAARAAVTLRLR